MVLVMKACQSSGTITRSMPALRACAQADLLQPGTCSMPFQSDTTRPSKPSRFFSTSVSISRLPCSLPGSVPADSSCQLLNETITVWVPAASAL